MKKHVNSIFSKSLRRRAVFIDRDGVLCEYKEKIIDLRDFVLRENIGPAIKLLNEHHFLVFVVTNQPQIAKGGLTLELLSKQHEYLENFLRKHNAFIDKIYFCPHREFGEIKEYVMNCDCRKPKPGMIQKAAQEYLIDLPNSFMVGDSWSDTECGKSMGLRCLGILGGSGYPYSPGTMEDCKQPPDAIFPSLKEAALSIINEEGKRY